MSTTSNVQNLSPIDRFSQDKALYTNTDRRLNLFENSITKEIKTRAVSIACLIESSNSLWIEKKDTYQLIGQTLEERIKKEEKAPLGPSEAFRDEPSLGNGTAFLVGPKLVLTAAHCVCTKDQAKMSIDKTKTAVRVVFGFEMTTTTQWQSEISKDKVYSINKVVEHSTGKDASDWALLELDREVKNIPPLEVDFINEVLDNQEIYMLGHPYGLPIKFTEGQVMPNQPSVSATNPHFFQANIDAFAGNSGSPIFNKATHKVVGMLVNGNKDWTINQEGLVVAHHVAQPEITQKEYEKCQKMSSLPKDITKIIAPSQSKQQTVIDTLWEKVLSLFAQNKALEAIERFETVTDYGLNCKYYEMAAFIQEKHPELASKIAANYLEKARISGFLPVSSAFNEQKINIKNDGVKMSKDAAMISVADQDGSVNNEGATITDQSMLASFSGKGGNISSTHITMEGNSQALSVANHPEGTVLALEQVRKKLKH